MLLDYLHYRRYALLLWLSGVVSVEAVALLAGLEREFALYGALIAGFLLLCASAVDYPRFAARVRELREICANLSDALHALPEPQDAVCAQYTEMLEKLSDLMRRERDALNDEHAARVDYYTMWLHQIKTPIAAMRLLLDSQAAPGAEQLQIELFRIERYVDMALQYAKLGSLGADMVLEPFELDTLVTDSVKKYAPLFIHKNLSVQFERTGLVVVSDKKWLGFILEQLLSNAAKYTERGGVRIWAEGQTLMVEDSGIGIRSDDIDRIFEKGYTGYNGRFDRRASGLGLFMSRRIADGLGMELYAERGRAQGACLCIGFGGLTRQTEAQQRRLRGVWPD